MTLIYCVEDDVTIRELVVYTLMQTGFEAVGFTGGVELFSALKHTLPDLLILDIMLPDTSGLTILQQIRETNYTKHIPIIMATAKGTEFDKIIGLDGGADDYIAKPFGMMELVARIKAVLRRAEQKNAPQNDTIYYGPLSINKKKHQVLMDEQRIDITAKEFRLLAELIENKGQVLTRDQLLLKIWGYDFEGVTRTVDVHIRTLRQKLGNYGDLIKTVHGVGYCVEEYDAT